MELIQRTDKMDTKTDTSHDSKHGDVNETGAVRRLLPLDGEGVEWLTYLIDDSLVIRKTTAVGGRPVLLIRPGVSLLTNPEVIPSMMHLVQHATSLLGLKSDREVEPYDEEFARTLLTTKRQSMLAPVVIGVYFISSRIANLELRNLLSSLQMPQPMWRMAYPMGICREVAAFVKPAGTHGVPYNTDAGMALLSQNVAMCDRLSRSETNVKRHAQGLLNPIIAEKGCLFLNVGQWRTVFTAVLRRSNSNRSNRSLDLSVLMLGIYELLHETFGVLFDNMPAADGEPFPCVTGIDEADKAVVLRKSETT